MVEYIHNIHKGIIHNGGIHNGIFRTFYCRMRTSYYRVSRVCQTAGLSILVMLGGGPFVQSPSKRYSVTNPRSTGPPKKNTRTLRDLYRILGTSKTIAGFDQEVT